MTIGFNKNDIKYVEIANNSNIVTKNISEWAGRGSEPEWNITIVSPVSDPLVTTTLFTV